MNYGQTEVFTCKDCCWIGNESEVPVMRDGDAYDPSTVFWRDCPNCGSKNVEEIDA